MTRAAATLEIELLNLALYDTEAAAIVAWADAFGVYFANATTAVGGPILAPGLATAKAAMALGLAGLSTGGAAAIASGVSAFWLAGVGAPVTWWAAASLIVPPVALTALQAQLETTFTQNIDEEASKATSMQRIADNIHTACTGTATDGTATFPGPIVSPIL